MGQIDLVEADPVEQFEGVRHACERCAAVAANIAQNRRVGDRAVGEDQRGADEQVAVDDGEAVAVRHR